MFASRGDPWDHDDRHDAEGDPDLDRWTRAGFSHRKPERSIMTAPVPRRALTPRVERALAKLSATPKPDAGSKDDRLSIAAKARNRLIAIRARARARLV